MSVMIQKKPRYFRWISMLCLTIGAGIFLSFCYGCDSEPPPKPKVITKKIIVPSDAEPEKKGTEMTAAGTPTTLPVIAQAPPMPPSPQPAETAPDKIIAKKVIPEETPITPQPSAVKPAEVPKKDSTTTVTATTVPKPESLPKSQDAGTAVAKATSKPEESPKEAAGAALSPPAESGQPAPTAEKPDAGSQESKPESAESKAMASASGVIQGIISADKATGYDPKGRLDPFLPLFRDEPEPPKPALTPDKPGQPAPPKVVPPLQKVDLSQLKLVGIVRSASGNRALVVESSGKGYIIIPGTYIGIHNGKVAEIQKDRVIIEEQDKTILGEVEIRKRELKLQRPPGEEEYHDL